MKIAVISDVHSNYVALQTACEHIEKWQPDRVVVAGDLVNRGPRPAECLDFIRAKQHEADWLLVSGNHEDYVLTWIQPDSMHHDHAREVHQASYWTYKRLNGRIHELLRIPFKQCLLDPDMKEVCIVHASMRGKRDGIYPELTDQSIIKKLQISNTITNPAVFCVGHTHRPLIRELNGTLVVNAGSVGLPFDMDKRLSYAQLQWRKGVWRAEIIRLDYDIQLAEQDFYSTGYLIGGGPLVELVLVELRQAKSQLYNWAVIYQDRVLNGEISMRESVNQILGTQHL